MPSLRLPRRRGSSHRTRNPKRRNAIIGSVIGVIVFVSALVLWAGGGSDDKSAALPEPSPTSTTPSPSASPSPSVSTSPTASPSGTSSAVPAGLANLPNLPGTDSNVNPADLPPHTTVISVVSDSPILRFGYKTAYGSSSKEIKYLVKSPATVQTGTRGYGAQAVIGAQAGPYATYVTCSITVDGKTRTTQSVKGAYKIVVCVG